MTELDFINRPITIKEPPDFTVVSTFAGCGGSSTGYVWAGGKVLLAVEWDNNAVETYKLNYPHTDVYHGDIAKITVDEVLERTGLQVGELDIFDGSPPCQGFSTGGKRILNDPRNQLFREYVRLLRGLKPKVFVMENVSGMVKGKMKLLFAEILTELKESGYQVSAKLLNAMYLGVPQARQRMIFIGVRDDLGIQSSHPKPQTRQITAENAVDGVAHSSTPPFDDKYANLWDDIPTPKGKKLTNSAQYVLKTGFSSCVKINPKMPAPTLPKTQTGRGFATVVHWSEKRGLTVNEAKRLQSFPDLYILTGDYSTQWARIGNSVPPEMMRRVALHIKDNILSKAKSPT